MNKICRWNADDEIFKCVTLGIWSPKARLERFIFRGFAVEKCKTKILPVFQSTPTMLRFGSNNLSEPSPFTVRPGSTMASISSFCLAFASLVAADCEAPSSSKALLQSKAQGQGLGWNSVVSLSPRGKVYYVYWMIMVSRCFKNINGARVPHGLMQWSTGHSWYNSPVMGLGTLI